MKESISRYKGSPELQRTIPTLEVSTLVTTIRGAVWSVGIPSWIFGIADRGFATFADSYISAAEALQLLTAIFLFVSWVSLRPEDGLSQDVEPAANLALAHCDHYLSATQTRMAELQNRHHHLISQEYILPYPYFCQIYHLLNLKHLETIHNFSLNNLKVLNVNYVQKTEVGGAIKFQTVLDSPANALRIWRQPVVEAGLTLHHPYTVELNVPVYNDKTIIVLFTVIPLGENKHRFLVDIYSNLDWPKPLLTAILHFAAGLTLFEDLPYLQKLAETNIQRLTHFGKQSNNDMAWLFNRFLDLHSHQVSLLQPVSILSDDYARLHPGT